MFDRTMWQFRSKGLDIRMNSPTGYMVEVAKKLTARTVITTKAKTNDENLCGSCNKSILTCDPEILIFNPSPDKDNIIECSEYQPKPIQNSAHSYTEGSEISFDGPEMLDIKRPCRHHEPGKQCDIFIGKEFCSTQPCEQ